MRDRFSGSMVAVTIAAATAGAAVPVTQASAQAPAASGIALKTPWGEPFKEFGQTNSTRRYNAPPSMRTRNSSPRRSGKS
jgi:hypothetical protein